MEWTIRELFRLSTLIGILPNEVSHLTKIKIAQTKPVETAVAEISVLKVGCHTQTYHNI